MIDRNFLKIDLQRLKVYGIENDLPGILRVADTALELLKETEPVIPVFGEGRKFWEYAWYCGMCNCELYHMHKIEDAHLARKHVLHCRRCGRKVNWDGAKGNGL